MPSSSRSVIPGTNASSIAVSAASAMADATSRQVISSGVLTRRAAAITDSGVDQFGGRDELTDQAREPRRQPVGADASGLAHAGDLREVRREVGRIPVHPVQVLVADLGRHALVPRRKQMDATGFGHHHRHGCERQHACPARVGGRPTRTARCRRRRASTRRGRGVPCRRGPSRAGPRADGRSRRARRPRGPSSRRARRDHVGRDSCLDSRSLRSSLVPRCDPHSRSSSGAHASTPYGS